MKKFIVSDLFSILASGSLVLGLANHANAQGLAPIPGISQPKSEPTALEVCMSKGYSRACCESGNLSPENPDCQQTTSKKRTYSNSAIQKGYDLMSACLAATKDSNQCDYKSMDREIVEGGWVACRVACGDVFSGHEFISGDNIGCETVCDNQWPDSLHGDFERAALDAIADWKAAQIKVIPKPQTKETQLPEPAKEKIISPQEKVISKPKIKEVPSPVQPQVQKAAPEPRAEAAPSLTPSAEPKPSRFQLIQTFYVKFTSPLKDFFRKVFRLGR